MNGLAQSTWTRSGWELDATLHGIRHGTVSVSYDVCRDIGRCGGLIRPDIVWFGESLAPQNIAPETAAAAKEVPFQVAYPLAR